MSRPIIYLHSPTGFSWYSAPKMGLLWIGVSHCEYERSFELRPVGIKSAELNPETLWLDGQRLFSEFNLNRVYYVLETSLQYANSIQ